MEKEVIAPPAPRACGSYREFWAHYLAEHAKPATRLIHVLGTLAGLALLVAAALLREPALLAAALLAGYGAAWFAHFAVEGNRPATFRHPLWSFLSDLRLTALWLAGRLEAEVRRHGLN